MNFSVRLTLWVEVLVVDSYMFGGLVFCPLFSGGRIFPCSQKRRSASAQFDIFNPGIINQLHALSSSWDETRFGPA